MGTSRPVVARRGIAFPESDRRYLAAGARLLTLEFANSEQPWRRMRRQTRAAHGADAAYASPRSWMPQASPAIGDKRVSDQRPDACFHGRLLHRPHARFAAPAPVQSGAAALVLAPTSSVRRHRGGRSLCSARCRGPHDRDGDRAHVAIDAVGVSAGLRFAELASLIRTLEINGYHAPARRTRHRPHRVCGPRERFLGEHSSGFGPAAHAARLCCRPAGIVTGAPAGRAPSMKASAGGTDAARFLSRERTRRCRTWSPSSPPVAHPGYSSARKQACGPVRRLPPARLRFRSAAIVRPAAAGQPLCRSTSRPARCLLPRWTGREEKTATRTRKRQ
jgi:hypothetical protein